MSTIQNIEQLVPYLSEEQVSKLEKGAARYMEQFRISLNINSIDKEVIEIETSQTETPSGKYASQATLIKRTEDLFRKVLEGYEIRVQAETVVPSAATVVNTQWIKKKMQEKGVRIRQIAFDTGIDRESISDWVTGKRSMSQIVKAMFYYYLSK